MHRNDVTIVCRKIWRFKQNSVRFSLGGGGGGGVNAILKKVGMYLQMTGISSATHPTLLNLLAN